MGHKAIRGENAGKSKVLIYGVLVFQIVLIGSLIRGIQVSSKSKERVERLQEKKRQLEAENAKLKEDVNYVQSDYYVEKVAREELQKAKPGEQVVILPENTRQNSGENYLGNKEEQEQKNWEKWWELLVN